MRTNNTIYFADIISAIGHNIRTKFKLPKNSSIAAKTGAFILWNFEYLGAIEVLLGTGNNNHQAYIVRIKDDTLIKELWDSVGSEKVEKLPSLKPYPAWTSSRHPSGIAMIKTRNIDVISQVTPETHPMLFKCLNNAQAIGWNINKDIYDVHLWALKNKTPAFNDIWKQTNEQARQTKLRETKAVGDIAKRFIDSTFYHLYYYDFR